MKLKKAKRLAAAEGFNYVAVDITREIWAYPSEPILAADGAVWYASPGEVAERVGDYSGSKMGYDTCKKV